MIEPVPFLDVAAMVREIRPDVERGWADLLDSGDFVRGRAVARFEDEWAEYCGADHAVGVANGTDALWLTLIALGLGAGDEVVLPANTFVATVEAVLHAGAQPRFADVDPATLLLTAETVERAMSPRTRVVVAVHLFGQVPDMGAISAVAAAHGALVVEDAAQAHGASWAGRRAGTLGHAACFSFYPGKNLGAFGDGGAVVTSDGELAKRIRSLADHGRNPDDRDDHTVVGFNSRLDTAQAVVLSAKLRRLDTWNQARRAAAAHYRARLDPRSARMVEELPDAEPAYHLAVVQVDDRDRLREELGRRAIATGIHYRTPCHLLAPYRRFADAPLPVVEAAAGRILSLPMSPHITTAQIDRVVDVLAEVVRTRDLAGVL